MPERPVLRTLSGSSRRSWARAAGLELFERSDQVGAYAGLVPRVYQSGDESYRGSITKEGDTLLRFMLVEAATVILSRGRDTALKRWGLRLQKKKGAGKARVAVARKLATILHRMWLTGTPYDDLVAA